MLLFEIGRRDGLFVHLTQDRKVGGGGGLTYNGVCHRGNSQDEANERGGEQERD